jgi:hypothetical protein
MQPSHGNVVGSDPGSQPGPHIVTGVTGSRSPDAPEVEAMTRSESQDVHHGRTPSGGRSGKATLLMLAEAERLDLSFESGDMPAVAPVKTELPIVESVTSMTTRVTVPTPDEMSIPPVGDLAVEPIADRFFSEGEVVSERASAAEHEPEWAEVVARESRKSLPEVVERRARLSKYVRWAVAGAAVVCVAAFGRTFVASGTHPGAPATAAMNEMAPVSAPEPKAALPAVAAPAPAEPVAAAEPAKTAELAAAAPAEAEPARVEAPKVDIPKAEAPAEDAKTALQEKNDARRALERGKAADAIAAGERSVALDATDGEAWLLLGAAYQEKGNMPEARRAYTACAKEGTHGPIGECRAMLR